MCVCVSLCVVKLNHQLVVCVEITLYQKKKAPIDPRNQFAVHMATEARTLAKKIAQPGQADGPVLQVRTQRCALSLSLIQQALMALDPLVATEANRRALIEERFLPTLTGLLQRKQEMVISGAITLINSLSLHEDMQTPLAGAGTRSLLAYWSRAE